MRTYRFFLPEALLPRRCLLHLHPARATAFRPMPQRHPTEWVDAVASGEPYSLSSVGCERWTIDTYSDGSHRLPCAKGHGPFSDVVVETDAHWLKRQARVTFDGPKPSASEVTFYDLGVRNEIAAQPRK